MAKRGGRNGCRWAALYVLLGAIAIVLALMATSGDARVRLHNALFERFSPPEEPESP